MGCRRQNACRPSTYKSLALYALVGRTTSLMADNLSGGYLSFIKPVLSAADRGAGTYDPVAGHGFPACVDAGHPRTPPGFEFDLYSDISDTPFLVQPPGIRASPGRISSDPRGRSAASMTAKILAARATRRSSLSGAVLLLTQERF